MDTILLTGFEPFGGGTDNPSARIALALQGQRIHGGQVAAATLPTTFADAIPALRRLLDLHRPVLTLCLGLAGGRSAISLERVAINVDDARIPDNAGAQPVDRAVVPGGPAAYFSTLPIKAMLQALRREGIPAEVSQTAGTFVCNHVFYGLLHLQASGACPPGMRGGFVHVPWLPAQGQPSLPLRQMVRGIHVALGCAMAHGQDITLAAGATH